jgi:hypothetical protein
MAKLVTFIEKEFILNQIHRTKGRILVFGTGKSVGGLIKSFDKDILCLSGIPKETEVFRPWEAVSVFLSYQNQRVTFPAKITKISGGDMLIGLPENLIKSPQRKAVRLPPPKDLRLEFYMQHDKVRIDSPESSEYSNLEMPSLSAGFDISSISGLLDSFKAMSSTMYSRNGIVMFNKGREPETIEERLVADYGRTLLISSMHGPLPSADPYPEGRIITQSMADAFEGPDIFLEGSALERSRAEKSALGVVSELFSPILYYQYVLGYVYLMNDESRKAILDYRAVDFAWEFSRILAYSLKNNNYFRIDETSVPDPYRPQIVDMSSTGCLFSMPKTVSKVKLKVGTILNVVLSKDAGDGTVSIMGRVARHLEDRQSDYYGIAFLNAEQDAVETLHRSLYSGVIDPAMLDESSFQI